MVTQLFPEFMSYSPVPCHNTRRVKGKARVWVRGIHEDNIRLHRVVAGIKYIDLSQGPVLKVPENIASKWLRIDQMFDYSEKAEHDWYEKVLPEIMLMIPDFYFEDED